MLLNNQTYDSRECTIRELLDALKTQKDFRSLKNHNVSVLVNGVLINPDRYDTITLIESDSVLIIPRLAGG